MGVPRGATGDRRHSDNFDREKRAPPQAGRGRGEFGKGRHLPEYLTQSMIQEIESTWNQGIVKYSLQSEPGLSRGAGPADAIS
jgi:hypothetical protein